MEFSWDENKNWENRKKHGIDFNEASEVFDDPLHISVLDKRFDYFDERWITLGTTKKGEIIVIGHLYFLTEDSEHIRIITARKATRKEREQYEKVGG
ncbi:MAG: BrnT family toxin [Nitrospirae bacterium]|nr:BrnT family toxin [Nitrospirota bacterium]MCL5237071.1 BrnT family toxin [Nitrospirota bacterium]